MAPAQSVVLASSNAGKAREIGAVLSHLCIDIVPQSHFDIPETEETGLTFEENALAKARHAAMYSGLPAIADDSGLEVDALGGAPGIYSARYAGKGATDQQNLDKLVREIAPVPDTERTARFRCAMVYLAYAQDPSPIVCHGIWEGRIVSEPKGVNGFGYDPVFFVPTHGCTSAELPPEVKNQLSHRGQALKKLLQALDMRYRTER
ncbi:MAG: RdgB/HAM1 family non-canonical purine NTP pyrophosphatase [Gammaproteobacteria bacterium]|nr:RdgB/HAM1 family non-canonical purine NTP pyrophosphatase [Gammaproteobacteria bacterium]MCI0590424.1 RdgB/HAM1 family non-canonical purine NTP pyrophosphatase [Gammaproteobacteria bacterium]